MDDRNPAKLLLAARDVLIGVIKPWYVDNAQLSTISQLRDDIDTVVAQHCDDATLLRVMDRCCRFAEDIRNDTKGVTKVFDRFDRARLVFYAWWVHTRDPISPKKTRR